MRFHDILVSTLLGATIPVQAASLMRNERAAGLDKKSQIVCSSEPPIKAAPHKNFWSSLTREETTNVLAFLHANATGLNLTLADEAGDWDNRITSVELLMPNKADILPLLNGSDGNPVRHALVAIMFGATEKPYMQEFTVGPLPITNSSILKPFTSWNNDGGDGKYRVDNPDNTEYSKFNLASMKEAEDITKFLWNLTVDDGLSMPLQYSAPMTREDDRVYMWQQFNAPQASMYDNTYLIPLGLYMRTDITGRDPSKWNVTGWVYNNVLYSTLDDLREATKKPEFVRMGGTADEQWTRTEKQGDDLPLDEQPPPVSIQRSQPRYTVDETENYVTWMDFSFYVSLTKDNGLRLYDVHYKGKRVLYELGLDEAIAHYAGIDPVQSNIVYFDSGNGFGGTMTSLVNGFDCPAYSTYLNISTTTAETTHTQTNALCMFEIDKGFPIQRHSWSGYTTISKNIAFTLRTVYSIGNYDYMMTYQFSLDGSIDISVRASGYITSAFYANNDEYGFNIHDKLSGSLHDHVITFKADFDILGEKNSLQKIDIVPTTEEYVWSNGQKRNTMKAKKTFIETEDDGKMNWSNNAGSIIAVVNKDQQNKYGEYPGWRIVPTGPVAHSTIENSSVAGKALNHATHHLYVTKQKDNEMYAVSAYNGMKSENPPVDFDKYFDGESLVQEDIVVWFNLGMHHMPHTGDIPNTVFTTAYSAMTIEPFNYNLGDPSMATTQRVLLKSSDGGAQITRYGAVEGTCAIDQAQLEPDLSGYQSSTSVLKYPYDLSLPDRYF